MYEDNYLCNAQPLFADKQTSFEPNLPINRTFLSSFISNKTLINTIDVW